MKRWRLPGVSTAAADSACALDGRRAPRAEQADSRQLRSEMPQNSAFRFAIHVRDHEVQFFSHTDAAISGLSANGSQPVRSTPYSPPKARRRPIKKGDTYYAAGSLTNEPKMASGPRKCLSTAPWRRDIIVATLEAERARLVARRRRPHGGQAPASAPSGAAAHPAFQLVLLISAAAANGRCRSRAG